MECQYCESYQSGVVRHRNTIVEDGEKKIAMRMCDTANCVMDARDKVCEEFEVASKFWCNKDQNWLYMTICIARQQKRYSGCACPYPDASPAALCLS